MHAQLQLWTGFSREDAAAPLLYSTDNFCAE